jgi:hypothetical protein
MKVLKIAQLEKQDWRKELCKFLLAYRSTPQISTGASPAKLMFGRELRTKLPELQTPKDLFHEPYRDQDWEKKLTGKMYSDMQRNACEKDVKDGDKVLIKNHNPVGKLAPEFFPGYGMIKSRQGKEVIIEKDGVEFSRDSSFVKPFISSDKGKENLCKSDSRVQPEVIRRSERSSKFPEKFNDFVTG